MFYYCEHQAPCTACVSPIVLVALRFMEKARGSKASLDTIHLVAITEQVKLSL